MYGTVRSTVKKAIFKTRSVAGSGARAGSGFSWAKKGRLQLRNPDQYLGTVP